MSFGSDVLKYQMACYILRDVIELCNIYIYIWSSCYCIIKCDLLYFSLWPVLMYGSTISKQHYGVVNSGI